MNTVIPISGSFENYFQSSLESGSRLLNQRTVVFSLSKDIVGTNIDPKSFSLHFNTGVYSGSITDNGEGKLIVSESNYAISGTPVGDIIYTHGMGIITDYDLVGYFSSSNDFTLKWLSNYPVFTTNIHCTVRDYEFNFTQNPTALTGSSGVFRNNVTGSDFQPYITAIGLYNDTDELIAVGKFGQPIPKTPHTDMTFVIKLDM
jgi:hypothetical protein